MNKKKKLKILMIAPTPFFADRGCHTQIYEQIKALKKLGHAIFLCTYHLGRDMPGLRIYRSIKIPWYKKLEAGPSAHKFYLDILLFLKSLRVALKIRPDIIHGYLHEGALLGFMISKIIRRPLLFDCQGSLTSEMKAHNFIRDKGWLYWFFYRIEKIIDNLANSVITQSAEMVDELVKKFKVKKEKVFLTMDGVNADEFKPGYQVSDLREKLGLPLNKKIVVYLGLLTKYQGVDCLIEAISYVLAEISDVHFLIMGYPNESFYQQMAEKWGVASQITFTGRINYQEAPRYLCLADLAVAPKIAQTEADGKIFNYMASQLPIIASDRPINKQILGETAIYTKRDNPSSLAQGIKKLLKDEKLAKSLAAKARKKAVKDYSWDEVGRRIEKIYFIILNK